jgi:hypothetical protein
MMDLIEFEIVKLPQFPNGIISVAKLESDGL